MNTQMLPPPERTELHVGYMRLTDSAPLILARDLGLYEKYGLSVTLQREVSWANIRDKVAVGAFDAAQMLAPMPLMATIGAGGIRAAMITGLVLSLNGNAITLAGRFGEAQDAVGQADCRNALGAAQALRRRLDRQADNGGLTLATVHAFSMHTFQLRLWLRAGGIDPDRDVRIIVLPPEQMVDSLARGIIDGFCVGEPWNSMAVQYGIGQIVATGFDIWNNAPEKVLGVTYAWHQQHPMTHLRLRLALMEACRWLREPANRPLAAVILGRAEHLDLPVHVLEPSLSGRLLCRLGGEVAAVPDFHVFAKYCAGFPWRSQAEWMLEAGIELIGKQMDRADIAATVQEAFRPDLYREAARYCGIPAPDSDVKREGAHAAPWRWGGVELGSDLMISGGNAGLE